MPPFGPLFMPLGLNLASILHLLVSSGALIGVSGAPFWASWVPLGLLLTFLESNLDPLNSIFDVQGAIWDKLGSPGDQFLSLLGTPLA